jgi:hypothetical protein
MPPAVVPPEPIAIFTHDYHSRSPLLSWPPTPADHLKQAEMLALKTFGALLKDIRSLRLLARSGPGEFRSDGT